MDWAGRDLMLKMTYREFKSVVLENMAQPGSMDTFHSTEYSIGTTEKATTLNYVWCQRTQVYPKRSCRIAKIKQKDYGLLVVYYQNTTPC